MDLIKIIFKNTYIIIHMSPPSNCQRGVTTIFYFLLSYSTPSFPFILFFFCALSPSTILSAPREGGK